MVRESSGEQTKTYIYEPESFRHLGIPRKLTSDAEDIVLRVHYRTYGNTAIQTVDDIGSPLRLIKVLQM